MEQFGGPQADATSVPQQVGNAAAEHQARDVRVLLVEDNDMNQQVATELLESAGAKVTVADHGGIAVNLLREGPQPPPFDIVLMDLQMPEMDGLTATRLLRAEARFDNLPIIAMTAHALVEERERCLQAGMNDHLTKPIDPDALFAALRRWTKPKETAPGATEKPQAAAASEVALPEVEGIDIAAGLRRVAGNKRLYRSLLEQFVTKQANVSSDIAEALNKHDREAAERMAHTLKGIAGNIGIGTVQEAAGRLEKAIRDGNPSAEALVADLRAVLDPHLAAIRTALGQSGSTAGPPVAFDSERVAGVMARLMSLIEANDGDAADAVQEVAAALGGRIGPERLDALRESINDFDFEAARTKLSQIAADFHLSFGGQDDNDRRQEAHSAG
jgi:CheY-like chemotaxis protein/HPt (histidine-containing phosphotransfer) domain-containing protein